MTIRPMTHLDIPAVVALQIAYLEGSIVTALGPRFLTAFHAATLRQPSIFAYVAQDENTIVGFVQATTDVQEFDRKMSWRVAWPMLRALSTRWLLIPRFLVHVLTQPEPQPVIPAELLLLVVDPAVRRHNLGRHLIAVPERIFSAWDIDCYRVAVRSQLTGSCAFYRACGFIYEQDAMILGAPMTYFTKQLRQPQ